MSAPLRLPEGWETNAVFFPVAARLSGHAWDDYINQCYENMPWQTRHHHPQDAMSSWYWDQQVELEYLGRLHAHRTDSSVHSSDTECCDEEEEEEDSPETEWRPLAPPEPAAPPANTFFLPCNFPICRWALAQSGTCPNCGSEECRHQV